MQKGARQSTREECKREESVDCNDTDDHKLSRGIWECVRRLKGSIP